MPAIQERPKIDELRSTLPICVLDDEPDHVELATTYLKRAGFPAHGTTNPAEALERVRAGQCRVVIADFKMPGMDGMTFLEKALQSDPGMYVILVTGFYSVDSAIEARSSTEPRIICASRSITRGWRKRWTKLPRR